MAGDTLSTAAVIAGGAGILFTGQNWIDPVLSLLIAALILWSSFGIVRETLNILLEGTPRGVSLPAIRAGMEAVEGVINVHDLHVWCLGSNPAPSPATSPSPTFHRLRAPASCSSSTTCSATISNQPHHHPVRTHRLPGARWLRSPH